MRKEILLRVVFGIVILLSIIFDLWYVSIPLAVIGIWTFGSYFEVVVFAFMHDVLFGIGGVGFVSNYYYTIASILILGVSYYLKYLVKD